MPDAYLAALAIKSGSERSRAIATSAAFPDSGGAIHFARRRAIAGRLAGDARSSHQQRTRALYAETT